MIRLYPFFFAFVVVCISNPTAYAQNWRTLFDEADSLYRTSTLDSAYKAHQRATAQAIQEFGKEHINYAQSIIAEGKISEQKGDYALAEKALVESNKLLARIDPFGPDQVETLGYMASLYLDQGKIKAAEEASQEALAITNKLEGDAKRKYRAYALGLLADVYHVTRQWAKAEPLLLEALKIEEALTGKFDRQYTSSLHAISNVYLGLQQYDKAQEALLEAIAIKTKLFGPDAPTLSPSLGNMGSLFLALGDYANAITYFHQSLRVDEKNGRINTLNYTNSLQNLGICYNHTEQYAKADSLQKMAMAQLEKLSGKKTIEYANALNNRASIYKELKKYEEANHIYDDVLEAVRAAIGTDNSSYAGYLNVAATASLESGNYERADSLNGLALSIAAKTAGKNSTNYATYLSTESLINLARNKAGTAIAQLEEALRILQVNFVNSFLYLAPRQKETFTNRWNSLYSKYFSMTTTHLPLVKSTGLLFNTNLFLKNMLLNEHFQLFSTLEQSADSTIKNRLASLRTTKNSIAGLYLRPIRQRHTIDSLEAVAETLEKELARQSFTFRNAQQALQVRWEDIRKGLKADEAAVELVSFPYHRGYQATDSTRYIALVLRPGDTSPIIVPLLSDEAPLRRLLRPKSGTRQAATLYATRGSEIDTDQLTRGDSLYQLVWAPIEPLLAGVKTVYLSPSGLLHHVSFAALPYPKKARKRSYYLTDQYQIRQLGSTRRIATQSTEADKYQNLLSAHLYGGIQYDTTRIGADRDTRSVSTNPSADAAPAGTWAYLPGSLREVKQIGQLIGSKATVVTGSNATETSLKNLSGQSPTVLHVATHGFVFSDPAVASRDTGRGTGGAAFERLANPLLRTGLLMAGANRAWQGGRAAVGNDDGILTAYEVANLNLSATKLVVLSACETALGDIRGSEGVFGLQRAFKMAGANYLIMSLWPVPDQATSDLMTEFYRQWKKNKTIRSAFQQAQLTMRKKQPASVWAAFVLIE